MGYRHLPAVLAGIALIVVAVLCVRHHSPRIETDLQERAGAALIRSGFGADLVAIDGREATLSGAVATDTLREQIGRIVADVRGVREVRNELTLPVAPPGPGR